MKKVTFGRFYDPVNPKMDVIINLVSSGGELAKIQFERRGNKKDVLEIDRFGGGFSCSGFFSDDEVQKYKSYIRAVAPSMEEYIRKGTQAS